MATPIREFGKEIEDSTQMQIVSFDATKLLLTVTFKSGATYEYYDVPIDVAENLLQAESMGRYFHRYVRGPYKYKKVEIKDDDQNGETGSL